MESMTTDELFARFAGYGVFISDSQNEMVMDLDVVSDSVSIYADDGFLAAPETHLADFLDTIARHKATLKGLARECENAGKEVTRGRLTARMKSGKALASIEIRDDYTGCSIHLWDGRSMSELLSQIKHNYRRVKSYIKPVFKIARSIERLPYEDYIAAMERDGYPTVHGHGLARLHMGRVDFRPDHQAAKVHSHPDDPSKFAIEKIVSE